MYLHTKFGCDRSIVVGCRPLDDRQTNKQTNIPTSGNDNKAHSLRDVTQQQITVHRKDTVNVAHQNIHHSYNIKLFYDHYTRQPLLARKLSQELEVSVGTKNYRLHILQLVN